MSLRRTAYSLHAWMGLKLSVLLFVVLSSGTVATVSHELDWLANPAIRAPGTSGAVAPETWDRMRVEAQRINPEGRVHWMMAPQAPGFAAEVHVQTPEGQRRRAWLHPETGELQGHTSYLNVQRFLRSLHYNLFLPEVGLYLVSATSLLLIGSLITGLIVYRRFWEGWVKRPRQGKGSRIWWGDLHKLLGLWSIPFVLVIGLTGVWYLVEAALFDTGVPVREVQQVPLSAERVRDLGPAPVMLPLSELVSRAEAAHPGFEVRLVQLPDQPGRAVALHGSSGAVLVRDRANKVFLDPFSGEELHAHMAWDLTAAQRWSHTADPLHFGSFSGLGSKLLYLAFGIALCVLQVAGTLVWWRRLRREKPVPPTVAGADARSVPAWRPGGFAVAGVPVLAAIVWFGVEEVGDYLTLSPPPTGQVLARAADGPWTVELIGPARAGEPAAYRVRLDCGPLCLPNVADVTLTDTTGTGWSMQRVRRATRMPEWEVLLPGGAQYPVRITLTARDGTTHHLAHPRIARDR